MSAVALEPIANAVPNRPVALATAFGPIAMAMLVGVLVQFPPLPSPQNEAQVALAEGAEARPALSRVPAAKAARVVEPTVFWIRMAAPLSVVALASKLVPVGANRGRN